MPVLDQVGLSEDMVVSFRGLVPLTKPVPHTTQQRHKVGGPS